MSRTGVSLGIGKWLPLLCIAVAAGAQSAPSSSFNTSGSLQIGGKKVPFTIRRLPPDSFPQLPQPVASNLESRGCLIPQTYQAHGPENVVHGSFERPGSSDWAILCSAHGTASLLVYFGSHAGQQPSGEPFVLAATPETERLQENIATRTLGFDWAIDVATPQQVHDAQIGLSPRPPLLGHDAVADSTIDRRTVYHFYEKGAWTLVDLPVE